MWASLLLLAAGCGASSAAYDYGDALAKSLLFYEAQRSGKLPADKRIPWRGDSALQDQGLQGEDLTGGYYDEGGHMKFGFPMASTVTLLAWGAIDFAAGYEAANQTDYVKDAVKWGADYFIKAHTGDTEFYGQCGNGEVDIGFWGRAEEMKMDRPCYKIDAARPGSDLAGETAAALAAASILFQDSDADYAGQCLDHAKALFDFANGQRGLYHDSILDAANFYFSSGYGDELAWAAAWLYRATEDASYLALAEGFFAEFPELTTVADQFSWDRKHAGVQLLLYTATQNGTYGGLVSGFCDAAFTTFPRTPLGLIFVNRFGALRHAANIALVCLGAAGAGLSPAAYRQNATAQLDYMLGDAGRSYVVGFGEDPPERPRHEGASCPDLPAPCGRAQEASPAANPQVLAGALVGGPGEDDSYADDRADYVANAVACDYNAGFQSALAALLSEPGRRGR